MYMHYADNSECSRGWTPPMFFSIAFFDSLEWRLPLKTEKTRGISHYSLFHICVV